MANNVPNFWTTPGEDPKRAYRFLVTFPNMPHGATWYAKKCSKPAVTIGEAKHSYINHTFYYPGRVEWDKVSITLVDPVVPDAANNLAALLEGAGYVIPKDPNDTITMSKAAAMQMLGRVVIRQLGSTKITGTAQLQALEEWTLQNAWITSVKFGELDYESDDLTSIDIELRYDWAELKTLNKDIAAPLAAANAGADGALGATGGINAATVPMKNDEDRFTRRSLNEDFPVSLTPENINE